MAPSRIPTVRQFYRSLTLRVGVFTDRFLGRERSLAQSRLLFEIGRDGSDIRAIRTRLNLDSGYLSRMLRSLEQDGLIEVTALASDLRSRRARLTKAGRAELDELDRLGDRFAEATLDPLSEAQRARLVDAMADVEKLLNVSFTDIAVDDPDSADAQACLAHYFAELDARFEDGFERGRSLPADAHELRKPHGVFVVARLDGQPIGCGAMKRLAPTIGSIKRMWVAPAMRGIGLGRRVLVALEREAASLGIRTLRLETNRALPEAHTLYRRHGYAEVPAFNDEAYAHHWFEKRLGGAK